MIVLPFVGRISSLEVPLQVLTLIVLPMPWFLGAAVFGRVLGSSTEGAVYLGGRRHLFAGPHPRPGAVRAERGEPSRSSGGPHRLGRRRCSRRVHDPTQAFFRLSSYGHARRSWRCLRQVQRQRQDELDSSRARQTVECTMRPWMGRRYDACSRSAARQRRGCVPRSAWQFGRTSE